MHPFFLSVQPSTSSSRPSTSSTSPVLPKKDNGVIVIVPDNEEGEDEGEGSLLVDQSSADSELASVNRIVDASLQPTTFEAYFFGADRGKVRTENE
jgi:hypothetical protein